MGVLTRSIVALGVCLGLFQTLKPIIKNGSSFLQVSEEDAEIQFEYLKFIANFGKSY